MKFGEMLAFIFLYNKARDLENELKNKQEEKRPKKLKTRVDFDLSHLTLEDGKPEESQTHWDFSRSYSTPKSRRMGAVFFILFIITTIVLFYTGHPFYGILAGFSSLCALTWPYSKEIPNE